ncbi:protein of unknown function [Agrobacterium pusense]|uniref:Uncharacterized protein n=1 Tax=Agrobacterium pusense TaxID=648995 RepID=U4PV11_9HYPH|nr:protein of unknown function [Agrobacterium pusense]
MDGHGDPSPARPRASGCGRTAKPCDRLRYTSPRGYETDTGGIDLATLTFRSSGHPAGMDISVMAGLLAYGSKPETPSRHHLASTGNAGSVEGSASGISFQALRSQLRGQPRMRISPYRVPFSPSGTPGRNHHRVVIRRVGTGVNGHACQRDPQRAGIAFR